MTAGKTHWRVVFRRFLAENWTSEEAVEVAVSSEVYLDLKKKIDSDELKFVGHVDNNLITGSSSLEVHTPDDRRCCMTCLMLSSAGNALQPAFTLMKKKEENT